MLQSVPRPNLFVVGDAKCGTSTLHQLFSRTPNVGTTWRKEFHFFSAPEVVQQVAGPGDDRIPRGIVQDEATYLGEFAALKVVPPVVVDVSPSYLQNPPAAARIKAFAPDAKIVITLREPAAKVFSQYVHLWSEGRETLPFEAAYASSAGRRGLGFSTMFDYEAGGYYAAAVWRYLELFTPEQVHIILFEELVGATAAEIARLEAFLGVELPQGPLPHANVGGRMKSPWIANLHANETLRRLRRAVIPPPLRLRIGQTLRGAVGMEKPTLDPGMARRLRQTYAADVAALEALIGRPTGWPAE